MCKKLLISVSDIVEYEQSFEIIAKEGRKYGLFLTLSTQLPWDIPIEILSQMGTFITHRLINQRDKEIVMHSLPTVSREVINYLPALGEGEAIISGAGLKDNLYVKINKPEIEPISDTPIFSWKTSSKKTPQPRQMVAGKRCLRAFPAPPNGGGERERLVLDYANKSIIYTLFYVKYILIIRKE